MFRCEVYGVGDGVGDADGAGVSVGGAVIGAELRVGNGHIILLPPLVRTDVDRSSLAQTLFDCLQRWRDRS